MIRTLIAGVALVALSGCTLDEIKAWQQWHAVDPIEAQTYLALPEVAADLRLDWDHDGVVEPEPELAPAVRLDPPAPSSSASSDGRCIGYEELLARYSPGWDVGRMSRIMYRESRCQPDASNACCSGLLQMHRIHVPEPACGVYSRSDLYDPAANICAAAELWRAAGYGAWSTS